MRTSNRKVTPEQKARIARRKRTEGILRVMIVLFLLTGVVIQGTLIIKLVHKDGESKQIQADIDRLNSDAANYQLTIDSNQNRQALRKMAITKLGMVEPGEENIRVVHVPGVASGDAQLAMAIENE